MLCKKRKISFFLVVVVLTPISQVKKLKQMYTYFSEKLTSKFTLTVSSAILKSFISVGARTWDCLNLTDFTPLLCPCFNKVLRPYSNKLYFTSTRYVHCLNFLRNVTPIFLLKYFCLIFKLQNS